MTQFKLLMALLAVSTTALSQVPVADTQGDIPIAAPAEPETVKVALQTSLGHILLLIEKERAPISAGNFLRYVDQKRLDGIGFYRAMKLDEAGNYGLIQAGLRGDAKKLLKPIQHEPTTVTGLSHVSGAISMARLAPGTATSDFFIVLGDLPALDAQPAVQNAADNPAQGDTFGYAVFGRVIEGMDVVKAILEQPRSLTAGEGAMKGQMLEPPLKILTVRRVD